LTKQKYKKVLIIRFSSIGDIVLTTPVIRCVKLQLGAEVHFLTKKSYESILIHNPHVDRIFTIQKGVGEVLPQLKLESYDAVIDLHKNLRSLQVRFELRKPYFSFNKINWQKWLMVNFKINRLPKVHIVERYFESIKSLNVSYDNQGLEPLTPKGEYRFPQGNDGDLGLNQPSEETTFQDISRKIFLKGKRYSPLGVRGFIAFAIGGAHFTKRLPNEKIIAICQKIKLPIILLGGKDDATNGEEIVLKVEKDDVFNACGKLTLEESALVIKNASKVITHDTGMMHIAAAFEKEIISIWGNTIPEFGMYPFFPKGVKNNVSIEVKNLPCRPCSKIGYGKCPKGHFKCMMDIDVEEVIRRVNESMSKWEND